MDSLVPPNRGENPGGDVGGVTPPTKSKKYLISQGIKKNFSQRRNATSEVRKEHV